MNRLLTFFTVLTVLLVPILFQSANAQITTEVPQVPTLLTEVPPLNAVGSELSPLGTDGVSQGPSVSVSDPTAIEKQSVPAKLLEVETTDYGYDWIFNTGTVNETFLEYTLRTGNNSPVTDPCCTSGYCGTFTQSPTIPARGCTCGCGGNALCNCHHSPNAGRPLAQQNTAYVRHRVGHRVNTANKAPSTSPKARKKAQGMARPLSPTEGLNGQLGLPLYSPQYCPSCQQYPAVRRGIFGRRF